MNTYTIKCDECKQEIGQTDDMSASAAGGICPECRTYINRRLDKAGRYSSYASNAAKRSTSAFQRVNSIVENIPLGQPILVGHHSEAHARADVKRIDNGMRKGIDEEKKSNYWAHRAESVENDTAIHSNDPAARAKLEEKIADLEGRQAKMVLANKLVRKYKKDTAAGIVALNEQLGFSEKLAASLFKPDFAGRVGFPAYSLTNNSGNIKRYKARLAELSQPQHNSLRLLTVKYAGECGACSNVIERGATAYYNREGRTLYCCNVECYNTGRSA